MQSAEGKPNPQLKVSSDNETPKINLNSNRETNSKFLGTLGSNN